MNTKAVFHGKELRFEPKDCRIEQVIQLRDEDYEDFCSNMLQSRGFLEASRDKMFVEAVEGGLLCHCVLVVGSSGEDGVLVHSGGYNFARFSAYQPHAKAFLREQVRSMADDILAGDFGRQPDGSWKFGWEDLREHFQYDFTEGDPLAWMLADELLSRDNVDKLTFSSDGIAFQSRQAIDPVVRLSDLVRCGLKDVHLLHNWEEHDLMTVLELDAHTLTAEGRRAWSDVLNARVEHLGEGIYGTEITLCGCSANRLRDFSFMLAGQCPSDEYDRWVAASDGPSQTM